MSLLLFFAGSGQGFVRPMRVRKGTRARRRSRVNYIRPHMIDWGRRSTTLRGLYRVFNASEFRFYRNLGSPPAESDTPFDANPTLPHTPADVFGDGVWFTSMSEFNGVLDSGFLPLGPNGETYLRLDVSGGVEVPAPPQPPFDVALSLRAGGVVRVVATYNESAGTLRAAEFVVSATFDGSAPAEDPGAPAAEVAIPPSGFSFLDVDLPAQADGTTVRVRVQSRRTDAGPTEVWSEGSAILQATADAVGPTAPDVGTSWRGNVPSEE